MSLRSEVCTERDPKTKLILPKTNALFPFFFELCVHIGVSMLFCSDAPLSLNALEVAKVVSGVGKPPTSQSITNAPI